MTEQLDFNWVKGSGRGRLYGLLSSFFRDAIDLEKMNSFFEACDNDEVKNLSSFSSNIFTCDDYQELKKFYLNAGKDRENEELKFKVEYAHLFLLPEGVHPYESVYRGRKKMLMDKPWEEVRNFYRRVGAMKDKEELHPEDHISTELGFMSFLSYLTSESLNENREIITLVNLQVEFIESHLLKWVPQLKENIINNQYAEVYKSVIILVDKLIYIDLENLKEIITINNMA